MKSDDIRAKQYYLKESSNTGPKEDLSSFNENNRSENPNDKCCADLSRPIAVME